MSRPRLALTMGDPAGIGPEICLRVLADPTLHATCIPVVFGDRMVLEACARQIDCSLTLPPRCPLDRIHQLQSAAIVDLQTIELEAFQPGTINAATGLAAYTYVARAIDCALEHTVQAVVTAPLSKEALFQAGIHYPGHTEIFAERTGATRWCMMQYSEEITCTFVTVHVGYHEVPALLTTPRILDVIELTAAGLQRIRRRRPKIVVCGLNPHAGEYGLFGQGEEERIIGPAIAAARARGLDVEGPVPPDTAFLPWKRQSTDAFVCMYHDQGHIPVKALAFDSAVNTTLGLPVIRTSVDHGTALDIAWQGKARPDSFFSAIRLALRLIAG
jgi:4-hydroxythreonine-4-phosphate dehydrogenase